MSFNSSTINEGTIALTIDGHVFSAEVNSVMTLNDALTSLNSWKFSDYCDWSNNTLSNVTDKSITIKYVGIGEASATIAFDGGTTGITLVSNAKSQSNMMSYIYFDSKDINDWENIAKWSTDQWGSGYKFTKGLIELCMMLFPTTEIVIWAPQSFNWNNNYLYPDGSVDYNSFVSQDSSHIEEDTMIAPLLECANYYKCKAIDVRNACGITPLNYGNFFTENNVHPTINGYERWAETIVKLY